VTVQITLDDGKQRIARTAAQGRFDRRKNTRHRWGYQQNEHSIDVELDAIGAEIAAGLSIGVTWKDSSVPDSDGDLGERIQVRHTKWGTGRLLVHPEDKDDHCFILVRGKFPTFSIVGWMGGGEAKQRQWWTDPSRRGRWCYAVPGDGLRSISTLAETP